MRILGPQPLDPGPLHRYGCDMSGHSAAHVRRITATIVVCALVVATVIAVLNRQLIQDEFAAASFKPTDSIIELKRSLDLTDAGRRVFLASRPTLDGTQYFNTQCAQVQHGATGHVLGCFVEDRIHLYNVTDPRVSGIVEVTAAHELLHATFARMRPGDRAALSEKLRKLYEERSREDPDLAQRMEMYSTLPPSAFAAELHSIFGSEQADLPDWLEEHYAQWFADRSAITESYRAYRSVFQGLQNEASSLRGRMSTLRSDIEARKVTYDADVAAHDADLAEFNQRSKNREFATNAAAREEISASLKARRAALEQSLNSLQDDINRYNEMRTELEQLAKLSTELEGHLDSALAPITTRPSEE